MFNHLLKTTLSEFDLTIGLVAHYLLNNNADDNHGTYDGTVVGTVDFQGDQLDPLSGSVTIPSTGGSWCSYWKDTGSGMTHTTSSTIPTSLATDNYSNLRIYSETKSAGFIAALEAEGYYPKPLTEPTTTNLVAYYPLTGTAEDKHSTYDSTENSATYKDDAEFGSVYDGGGSITVNTSATALASWCCYWVDSGSGWTFTKTTTIPSSLTTNDYRNLRLYSSTPSTTLQDEIEEYEKNFRPIDIDDGLVAYYPLADNSNDNYYNEYDCTDSGTPTYDGTSVSLNGTSQYLDAGDNMDVGTSDFTVSFWTKPDEVTATILGKTETASGARWSIAIINYVPAIQSRETDNSGFDATAIGTTTISSTAFSLITIVVSRTNDEAYAYIDGEYTGTLDISAVTGDSLDNAHTYKIGRYGTGTSYYDGSVAKLRHYSKAITAEQVKAIYDSEKGDFI